jgi:VanZ like family
MAKVAPRTGPPRSSGSRWRSLPAVRWGTLVLVLGAYAIASLEPFDWQVPKQLPNHAERTRDGWRFAAPGIVLAEPPHEWLEPARAAETLALALVVRPHSAAQSGPARIVTMSWDTHMRNLTLAQENADLVLRLRTQDTDLNGLRDGEPLARVRDVFGRARWVAIDLDIRPGQLTIAVDGRPAVVGALPPKVLETWHPAFGLALGNETTCDRPWLGEIRAAVVEAPGRKRDYAKAANARRPAMCWAIGYMPTLVPLRVFLVEDAIRNTLMYIPLGVLLGLMMRARARFALVRGVLAIVGVSVTFEITQLFVASRFPSIDDVLFNAAGGSLGLVLAALLTRRRRRCARSGLRHASQGHDLDVAEAGIDVVSDQRDAPSP